MLAGLGLIGVVLAERPMEAASEAEALLGPTPLVLKDGRIANVSIHDVRFGHGQAELSAEAGADLTGLTRTAATDCFLTAQAIGHVDSSEIAEQDRPSAHRLALARADAVQASLIHGGLPAKSVASIWDWQFMVREARATLWLFQLIAGEDCEGRPLREVMVVQAPQSQGPQTLPDRRQAAMPAGAPIEPAPEQGAFKPAPLPEAPGQPTTTLGAPIPQQEISRKHRPPESPEPYGRAIVSAASAKPDAPERAPQPTLIRFQVEGTPARSGMPSVTLPIPPVQPKAATEPTERSTAAMSRDSASPPPRVSEPAAADSEIQTGSEGRLVITFAANSSYCPPGTRERLRQLIAGAAAEKRYQVSLQVAVSGTSKVAGAKSAKEAARYNTWLAQRRLERVQQWLLENALPDMLFVEPEYRTSDESRQVILRLVPAS